MNLAVLLAPIDAILKKRRIRYAVIGGYAVAAWGDVRTTHDLDLLCAGDSQAVIEGLKEGRLQFEHRIGDYDDPISEVIRIEIGQATDPFEVDILIGIREAPEGLVDRARIINIEGMGIPVASPEDTILLKLLGGSARDLDDAKSIIQIQSGKLDLNLIRKLCAEHIKSLLEKLLQNQ
jgi:predicted nucleotidyltransferase